MMKTFKRISAMLKELRGLRAQIAEIRGQIAELQDRLSVVDGRSSLNAERNVRTHSSVQNLAEDVQSTTKQMRLLTTDVNPPQTAESEDA